MLPAKKAPPHDAAKSAEFQKVKNQSTAFSISSMTSCSAHFLALAYPKYRTGIFSFLAELMMR